MNRASMSCENNLEHLDTHAPEIPAGGTHMQTVSTEIFSKTDKVYRTEKLYKPQIQELKKTIWKHIAWCCTCLVVSDSL